jgi:hypothetical protein
LILEKIKEHLERFFITWGVILVLNQLFLFHGCFYPNCLIAALPHTGVIAFLFVAFTFEKVEDKTKTKKNQEKELISHEEVASPWINSDDNLGVKKPDISQSVNSKPIPSAQSIKKTPDDALTVTREASPEIVKKIEYKNIIPYLDFRNVECFYHFTERRNLRSILQSGGLMSFQELKNQQINVIHVSNELSWELDAKGGLSNYIRLSFVKNHPMFWKAKYEMNVELIWIQIDREIATWENTKFTDKNATDKNVKLGSDLSFLKTINYDAIHKSKDGYNILHEEKKHAQSEILVERFIPKKYFLNLSELERMI